ncbi:MAG: recombinase family protein [Deltaproteobacteria bacterium]|nr:recombinase family protein [Deltaproteobacteria bacterium]
MLGPDPDHAVSWESDHEDRSVVYSRVSSSQNRNDPDSQAELLRALFLVKGWTIGKIVRETGSGPDDARPKLLNLLSGRKASRIVSEHEKRQAMFGFSCVRDFCK